MAKKKAATKKSPVRGVKKKAPKKGSTNKYRAEEKTNKPDAKKAAKKVEKESSTPLTGKNVVTLLDVPNRKKLPPEPSEADSRLFDIVKNHQDEYKEFLAFIRDGYNVSTACAGSGIGTYTEIMTYLKRGMQDVTRSKVHIEDTYYSRFYIDFNRTAGIAVGEAEVMVKAADPKFWLRNSQVSRVFGDNWRDDPDKKVSHVHTGSIEHFLDADSSQKANPDELVIEGELVADAIEELAHAGLVNLTDDYAIARRIQRGEMLSDDELQQIEDEVSTGSEGTLKLNSDGMPLLLPSPDDED